MLCRPIQRSVPARSQGPLSTLPSATPPSSSTLDADVRQALEEPSRDSVWTYTSTSIPTQHANLLYSNTRGVDSRKDRSGGRARSLSQSTIDAQSTEQGLESGAFKVVINRADSVLRSSRNQRTSLPTLEVPIPHYRLGTPRFSARGTAFLHSSVYTGSSTNGEDLRSSVLTDGDYDQLFPVPPGKEPRSVLSRRHSHASPQSYTIHITPVPQGAADSTVILPGTNRQHTKPILPAVFDDLAANPDNPSIVRYAPMTKEIIAASPARIIAQVTSENFLDYELLSDFFLTVRSYLSTKDLLSYLVARFEWAINRFDDNGRVIRVRAFAALRHWILNYFSYDFVLDRDLRVQFCDRLNELTKIIRGRVNYGNSDMKLISDLKKCWNGRCALYWDYPETHNDNQQDIVIHPGGISGSRNSKLSHPSQLRPKIVGVKPPQSRQATGQAEAGGMQGFNRQYSTTTIRSLPISPISEQSIQAMSCTILAKGFRKTVAQTNRGLGNHPVSAASESHRICPAARSATANEKVKHSRTGHKRSGSFSDAARDNRASLSAGRNGTPDDQARMAYPYSGSLIRGNLVLPVQPYVRIFAPTTPAVELPTVNFPFQDQDDEPYDSRKLGAPNAPGVKTLLGSIRRALSRKYSGSSVSMNPSGTDGSVPSLSIGKSSALPSNLVYQAGFNSPAGGSRSNMRVDLLAADIGEAFRRALEKQSEQNVQRLSHTNLALANEVQPDVHESLSEQPMPVASLRPNDFHRLHSEVTNGSQSIFIVDDTGASLPQFLTVVEAGVIGEGSVIKESDSLAKTRSATPPLSADPSTENLPLISDLVGHNELGNNPLLLSSLEDARVVQGWKHHPSTTATRSVGFKAECPRLSMNGRGQSFKSNKSGSLSLRKYASFQSTFTRHVPEHSFTSTVDGIVGLATDIFDGPPPHLLRRRPGGNLRANQNVHDLKQLPRARSTGSLTTCTDSSRGSAFIQSGNRTTRNMASHKPSLRLSSRVAEPLDMIFKKSPSLVQTHSSQPALRRPSFEAAVAEFARIPDDEEGGIEATLLKLEGKYQRSPTEPASSPSPPIHDSPLDERCNTQRHVIQAHLELQQQPHKHMTKTIDTDMPRIKSPPYSEPGQSTNGSLRNSNDTVGLHEVAPSFRYTASDELYNSIPLLERDLGGGPAGKQSFQESTSTTIPRPLFARLTPTRRLPENESIRRFRHGSHAPTATTDSFLLDEDEFLSDLSSDMDDEDGALSERWISPIEGPQVTTLLSLGCHPPSPPMTIENALSISSQANQAQDQRKPPTPDPSPVSRHVEPDLPIGLQQSGCLVQEPIQPSLHLCFILGYDSELLAQQFTIIEKDALNEIDWRDLVDMRWNNSSPQVTNWVNYLQTHEPRGIDLVTARFNVIVKWALSEIILTRNIEERALTIMKYIHIAQQSRKIHNYATLLQLTIALTSVDCTRLTKTWEMIPAAEKKILQDLETLVTPLKNFHNLRSEMEKANADDGCIPVVGMFHSIHVGLIRLGSNIL